MKPLKDPLPPSVPVIRKHHPIHSPTMDNDELFIQKTLETNPELGVELLYRRYYQPLCTHAIKFVGSRQVAEDMVSDLFYDFYTNRIYTTVTPSYASYLFKAIRNKGYNYFRWELGRNISMSDEHPASIPEYQQPDMITQYEELYKEVEKAINSLPHQRREIYLQFQFEGKPVKEIAKVLALSSRTIEAQIYRARIAIRQQIRDKWLMTLLFATINWTTCI